MNLQSKNAYKDDSYWDTSTRIQSSDDSLDSLISNNESFTTTFTNIKMCHSDDTSEISVNNRSKYLNEKEIIFSDTEIPQLLNLIIGTRKKFSTHFTNILTIKLQKLGFCCSLVCKSNYFSMKTSSKKTNYWSGSYYCRSTDCDLNFKHLLKLGQLQNYLAKYIGRVLVIMKN